MEKPGYREAIRQIEETLQRISTPDYDIEALAADVTRATELIAGCKEQLCKAEEAVNRILDAEI